MKFVRFNKKNVVLEVKNNEICLLLNAVNEICNGIKLQNFENIVGANLESTRAILESLSSIYKDGLNE